MKLTGMIDDVKIESKTVNGAVKRRGTFNFLVMEPMQVLQIRITEAQVSANFHEALKQHTGKQVELPIHYKDSSFAGEDGKHLSFQSFVLHDLPESLQKSKAA